MGGNFIVHTSKNFDKEVRRLVKGFRDLTGMYRGALQILSQDPHNTLKKYRIKKLTGIDKDEGQWRIRIGNYRIRYDITGKQVTLYSINHRKDAYR